MHSARIINAGVRGDIVRGLHRRTKCFSLHLSGRWVRSNAHPSERRDVPRIDEPQGTCVLLDQERYNCVMNVVEYAKESGVSPRRVRALAESGRLHAHKIGARWEIHEATAPRQGHPGRPLSDASRRALAGALHQRTLEGLTGQTRARTAKRIRELREADDPASLLIAWWGAREPDDVSYGANLVAHALEGHGDYVRELLRGRRREYLRTWPDLAATVSAERAITGVSRTELAERAGVDVRAVTSIEKARPIPSVSAIRRVLRAIGVVPTAIPSSEPA